MPVKSFKAVAVLFTYHKFNIEYRERFVKFTQS